MVCWQQQSAWEWGPFLEKAMILTDEGYEHQQPINLKSLTMAYRYMSFLQVGSFVFLNECKVFQCALNMLSEVPILVQYERISSELTLLWSSSWGQKNGKSHLALSSGGSTQRSKVTLLCSIIQYTVLLYEADPSFINYYPVASFCNAICTEWCMKQVLCTNLCICLKL